MYLAAPTAKRQSPFGDAEAVSIMKEWEVRRGDQILAHGPEATFPTPELRKALMAAGYKIFVDGKRFPSREKQPAQQAR